MSYAAGPDSMRVPSSRFSLLPFLGTAVLLVALRLIVTAAGGAPNAQTQAFVALWIASSFADAIAGWLLWRRRRTRAYGRPAVVLFWVQIVFQLLRMLDLLGFRLSAGAVPWSAFGTVVLLDLLVVVNLLVAWPVSRRATVILCAVLAWLLFLTADTGADALLHYGLPLT